MPQGLIGADSDELRALGGRFESQGDTVADTRTACSEAVESVLWSGADADAFRAEFALTADLLDALAEALAGRARDLEAQAGQQDVASRANASGAGAGGFGKGAPRITPNRVDSVVTDERLAELAALDDPQAVADYFASLGYDPDDPEWVAALEALGRRSPSIGDLEGAPYVARDEANLAQLDGYIADARAEFGVEGPVSEEIARLEQARADALDQESRRTYQSLIDQLDPLMRLEQLQNEALAEPDRQLVDVDIDEHGNLLAAISDRNLDTAAEATFFVPGMYSDSRTIPELLGPAGYIRDELGAEGGSHAMVAWTGYDSPDFTTVNFNESAERGGERLAETLAGMQASRGESVDVNVVAHSYGTTTADFALSSSPDAYGVDDVFYLGSAGLADSGAVDAQGLPTYSYGDANLYASTSNADLVAPFGRLAEHPNDPSVPEATSGFTTFNTNQEPDEEGRTGSSGHDLEGRHEEGTYGYLDERGKAVSFIAGTIRS